MAKQVTCALLLIGTLGMQACIPHKKELHPNILFIAIDDLRPELKCYGKEHIQSPNIDALAAAGRMFTRAYCMQAVCAPSRNSMLTGLRPDALGIYDLQTFFRTHKPGVVTLPQHFREQGYHTEAMGKIYHTGHGNRDDSLSWSVPHWWPSREIAKLQKIVHGDTAGLERDFPSIHGKKLPWYASRAPEAQMTDAMIAAHAVERIRALRDSTFFLAVGFIKPHLPFVAPGKYWELYEASEISVPDTLPPVAMPDLALHQFGELRKYHGIPPSGLLSHSQAVKMIHGYYACISYVDTQVGKLLEALEDNRLGDNTIVVLWGDHGWKLGEYGSWCKHTNFEMDANAPLIISTPGMQSPGVGSSSLVEFIDVYPTLCALANLEVPGHVQGESLVPVLDNPKAGIKQAAFSQYPRGPALGYDHKSTYMGYSMRTEDFRYTRWVLYEDLHHTAAEELYDLREGPAAVHNLAVDPQYRAELQRLGTFMDSALVAQWQQHPLLRRGP